MISVSPEGKIALSIRKALPQQEQERPSKPRSKAPAQHDAPRVWQPPRPQPAQENMSFEDMMSRYKQRSEEKIGDLNRSVENRRGGRRK